ncbi:hypothetical protein ANAEL_02567 [Anaerolineales bacterium]|nr:hypothetical protein ANAEL_02567 [Anaerolineales bacterium]
MTKQTHDHIHIFDAATSPTHAQARKYSITMTGIDEKPVTPVAWRRSLTGALLVTTLLAGGHPVLFRDRTITLLLPKADKEALVALSGKLCWLVEIEHDDAGASLKVDSAGAAQGFQCLMVVERATHVDPMQAYWLVTVQITEDSST